MYIIIVYYSISVILLTGISLYANWDNQFQENETDWLVMLLLSL